jgi:hypothetical protein
VLMLAKLTIVLCVPWEASSSERRRCGIRNMFVGSSISPPTCVTRPEQWVIRGSLPSSWILILGLGIGVNSAIFSLADALLLRPLPVFRPGEVVTVSMLSPNSSSESTGALSYRDYLDYRDKSTSFSGLAASSFAKSFGFASRTDELPKLKGGLFVSGNLFQVMGVQPELGRWFNAEEGSRARCRGCLGQ